MSSKIINKWWYTDNIGHCIGIIKTKDNYTDEIKYRIGIVSGKDEELDAEFLKIYGTRFYPNIIE